LVISFSIAFLRNNIKYYYIISTSIYIPTALDAYCLLEIYDVLEKCSKDLNIPFEEISYEVQFHSYKDCAKTSANKSAHKV